jgi:hypothetical protein
MTNIETLGDCPNLDDLSISNSQCKQNYYKNWNINSTIEEGSIILKTVGRTGNQLFEYASAYSLAQKTDSKLYICLENHPNVKITEFNIPKEFFIPNCNDALLRKIFQNTYKNKVPKVTVVNDINYYSFANKKNYNILIMDDFFQFHPNFEEYKKELLEQFTITSVNYEKLLPITTKLSQKNSVCIHFRKGDTVNLSWHYTPIAYQTQAIELSKKLLSNPKFYIFSDEINKVKLDIQSLKNIDFNDIEFMDGHNPIEDLYLMSQCGNNVIARSSFSWWAAYLNKNNGFVIAPYKSLHESLFDSFKYDEVYTKKAIYNNYYPKNWLLLDDRKENIAMIANEYLPKAVSNEILKDYVPREFELYSGNFTPLKICQNDEDFRDNICFEHNNKPTVVTAYYKMKSKYSHKHYLDWARNFLQIAFNLVIYTDQENVDWIKQERGDLPIIIIEKKFEEFESYKLKDKYEYFASIDPEKNYTPELYMVWAEKVKFVNDAINANHYNSELFIWCDIGVFREKKYINNNFLSDKNMITDKISAVVINEATKQDKARGFINSRTDVIQGGFAVGGIQAWKSYDFLYDLTRKDLMDKNILSGKEQTVISSMSIRYPKLFNLIYQKPNNYENRWWYGLNYFNDTSYS